VNTLKRIVLMGLSSGGLPSGGAPLGSVSIQKFVQLSECTGNFYLNKNAFNAAQREQGLLNQQLVTHYLDTQTLQRSPQDRFFTVQQTPIAPDSLNPITQFLSTRLKPLQLLLQNIVQPFTARGFFQGLFSQTNQPQLPTFLGGRHNPFTEVIMASIAGFFLGERKEVKQAKEEARRLRDLDDALFAQQEGGLLAIQAPAASASAGGNSSGGGA
jgi:hypothetical protein